ncbi:hypothetical protein BDN71DRAFT_1510321 [Pleurotus eryngii]|uniref:Uncharacterized protein n=1 Tax=Pleurotus eryngii TaxID=5323 RepID=A0A9P5ZPV2_PLEER|nr:hypothetical protein BDN71DRAFT_1510321 [Pleurotus eryngii]
MSTVLAEAHIDLEHPEKIPLFLPFQDTHPISEENINDALHAEWARLQAHATCWAEEYELVQEEMQQVIAYLKWDAEQWQA